MTAFLEQLITFIVSGVRSKITLEKNVATALNKIGYQLNAEKSTTILGGDYVLLGAGVFFIVAVLIVSADFITFSSHRLIFLELGILVPEYLPQKTQGAMGWGFVTVLAIGLAFWSSQYYRSIIMKKLPNLWPNSSSRPFLNRPWLQYFIVAIIGGFVGYLVLNIVWQLGQFLSLDAPILYIGTDEGDACFTLAEKLGCDFLLNAYWAPILAATAFFTAFHFDSKADNNKQFLSRSFIQGLISAGFAFYFAGLFAEKYREFAGLDDSAYTDVELAFVVFAAILVFIFTAFIGYSTLMIKHRREIEAEEALIVQSDRTHSDAQAANTELNAVQSEDPL